jgi:hypothetical protein
MVHIGAPERCAVTTMELSVGAGSWAVAATGISAARQRKPRSLVIGALFQDGPARRYAAPDEPQPNLSVPPGKGG